MTDTQRLPVSLQMLGVHLLAKRALTFRLDILPSLMYLPFQGLGFAASSTTFSLSCNMYGLVLFAACSAVITSPLYFETRSPLRAVSSMNKPKPVPGIVDDFNFSL